MSMYASPRDKFMGIGLEWLHERCVDVDGCLVWKLAAAHGTDPQVRIGAAGRAATILVRRALWELTHECPIPANNVARAGCGTELCVHPEHIVVISKSALHRGRPIPLTQRARIAATKRAQSRLSDAAVAFIRATSGPLEPIAEQFGIDSTYVSHIRLGKVRIDYASPFTGLGKRHG